MPEMRLYAPSGRRLYLNASERQAFRSVALRQKPELRFLCLVLLHSGCRLSEALALTRESFQEGLGTLAIVTLKKRRPGVVREVPVPDELFTLLRRFPAGTGGNGPIWRWHRGTAWRYVKAVMTAADIHGDQAMPKGLRHGFGVHAIQCGVPLNLVAKWMGHADMRTTAIYANATGPEERRIAERMWSFDHFARRP